MREERLSLAVAALGAIDDSEPTKCRRKVGPFLAISFSRKPNILLSKWNGLGLLAFPVKLLNLLLEGTDLLVQGAVYT